MTKPGKTVLKLDVPYVHQVNDIEGADGDWACGPTSVLMVLAYYGKLEPWHGAPPPAQQAGEEEMKSDFAPYLTNAYTYAGHNFNTTAPDPRGNRVAGLYGTIAPTGLADWGRIKQVLGWYGLQTQSVTPTWAGIIAALKRGHPVLLGNDLTPAGHILVAVGYTANNQLIVNDPYGNRFAVGYGANNGQGVYYPWSCSRVRNALEVVGTRPQPTATPTYAPTATAISVATVMQGVSIPAGGAAASADPSEGSDAIAFAVRAIANGALLQHPRTISVPDTSNLIPDRFPDYETSNRRLAIAKQAQAPGAQLLAAQRSPNRQPSWWLALAPPTFLALAGFGVTLAEKRGRPTTKRKQKWLGLRGNKGRSLGGKSISVT